MNDDVNDAAWILVHSAEDLGREQRWRFTPEELAQLTDRCRLYLAVLERYEVVVA